ncbi:hypothetical protein [Roseibium sp. RKSG952]|uniref:hypothetical protein n=1 Tax=Roseibium sp. RKSG952 TaxID=2529384 RepID=UPI0012BD3D91|nr:hypothetical protein [Roseibium sp. RKSG952]MTH95979.1 hypothetical protein [Roseibium sp. RKSG952]
MRKPLYLVDPDEFAFIAPPEVMTDLTGVDAWGLAIVRGTDVEYLLYPSRDGEAKLRRKASHLPTCPAMSWGSDVAIIDHRREMDLLSGLSETFSVSFNSNERSSSVVPGFRPAAPTRQGELAVKVQPFGIDIELTGELAQAGWMAGYGELALHVSDIDDRLALVRTKNGVQTNETDKGLETCHSVPGVSFPNSSSDWVHPEYRVVGDAVIFRLPKVHHQGPLPSSAVELPESHLSNVRPRCRNKSLLSALESFLVPFFLIAVLYFFLNEVLNALG